MVQGKVLETPIRWWTSQVLCIQNMNKVIDKRGSPLVDPCRVYTPHQEGIITTCPAPGVQLICKVHDFIWHRMISFRARFAKGGRGEAQGNVCPLMKWKIIGTNEEDSQ